ncbi:MAG TPA: response regulator [Pseudolabrys sp.]|nr:response regulator [Pseudolabrys sp.]
MTANGTSHSDQIFIVDDDPAVREMLRIVLAGADYEVVCFADGPALLASMRDATPACIILDVHIPGPSGLMVLKELRANERAMPIFIISGAGDIPMAVEAIKNGALDFIQKPFRGSEVVQRVREAIAASMRKKPEAPSSGVRSLHFPGMEPLTARERDVLEQIVAGASSKEAGRALGISPRTIEIHRARIMDKLGAKNAADLIRIVLSEGRVAVA